MYAPHFGLQREPFSIAPDPRFLFMSDAHREALAHLLYGVSGGGGFVLLTGEIGAGKTTVCRCFLDQVPAHCDVAYVFNPKLSVTELLQTVCDEFGIALPTPAAGAAGTTVKGYVDALNAHLLRSHAAGRHSVLIIDEAQSLSAELLEQLRLLTNLETAERKLLQIVLIGQPELRTLLARPDLEQLAQRVLARFHLPALRESETLQYVQHRLAVAGLAGQMPFDSAALRRMHQLCAGVPRRLNLLADRALLGAYAGGRSRIDRAIVDRAAREVFGSAPAAASPWPMRLRWAAGVSAVAACVGVGVALLQSRVAPPRMAAAATGAAAAAPLATRPSAPAAGFSSSGGAVATGNAGATSTLPLPLPFPLPAAAAPASLLAALNPAGATGSAAAADRKPPADVPAAAALTAASDAAALWVRALRSEAAGFGELARLWRLVPAAGDPCQAAARQQVLCWRSSGGLGALRELGRPAVLVLRDGQAQPRYAVLTGLADAQATLRTDADGAAARLPLGALPGLWRGEFATLWRAPPGYTEPVTDAADPALADWLDARLPGAPGQALKPRLLAFQLAQGLKPDGLAGPLTLMHINRASGVAEPQLTTTTER